MATTTVERVGARVYAVDAPFAVKDELKRIGCHWDSGRRQWWIGAKKAAELEALVERINAAPNADAPDTRATGLPTMSERDDCRVYAKVTYKGSNWYVVAEAHDKGRCKICKLSGVGFWVDMADCEIVKTYAGRPERGAYGRPTGRTVYTTLGTIRSFVSDQRDKEARDVPQCAACGKRSDYLVEDMEDGCMKCRGCCDMPP